MIAIYSLNCSILHNIQCDGKSIKAKDRKLFLYISSIYCVNRTKIQNYFLFPCDQFYHADIGF